MCHLAMHALQCLSAKHSKETQITTQQASTRHPRTPPPLQAASPPATRCSITVLSLMCRSAATCSSSMPCSSYSEQLCAALGVKRGPCCCCARCAGAAAPSACCSPGASCGSGGASRASSSAMICSDQVDGRRAGQQEGAGVGRPSPTRMQARGSGARRLTRSKSGWDGDAVPLAALASWPAWAAQTDHPLPATHLEGAAGLPGGLVAPPVLLELAPHLEGGGPAGGGDAPCCGRVLAH